MKKLSDKNKRWLTIAGLGVVCIVLAIAISSQFKTKAPVDDAVAPASTAIGEVNPSHVVSNPAGEKDVVVQTHELTATSTETPGTAVSAGTEQTIQPDPAKLEAPVNKPTPQGETTNPSKAPTYKQEDTTVSKPPEPKGGEKKDGKVYLPGFGWVNETGGSGTTVGKPGDELTGNKVGSMD